MELDKPLQNIIRYYENTVKGIDKEARAAKRAGEREYGGVIRAGKGKLQENITEGLVRIAWQSVGGDSDSLEINSKKISIPIKHEYIESIEEPEISEYIRQNIDNYVYKLSVDKHIFIDDEFVIGIESKAYTENAMMKRILIDFGLLKTQYPNLSCYLFQLESQLGGDYSELEKPVYGSHSTHTLRSHIFSDLKIITFLEGERKVDQPIHKTEYFKPIKIEILRNVVSVLAEDMRRFL